MPPARFENATNSLARSRVLRSSLLNSTPEFSPFAMISSNSVRVVMRQKPYFERRISKAALPPSRISSTNSRTGLGSIEAICFGTIRAWPSLASHVAARGRG